MKKCLKILLLACLLMGVGGHAWGQQNGYLSEGPSLHQQYERIKRSLDQVMTMDGISVEDKGRYQTLLGAGKEHLEALDRARERWKADESKMSAYFDQRIVYTNSMGRLEEFVKSLNKEPPGGVVVEEGALQRMSITTGKVGMFPFLKNKLSVVWTVDGFVKFHFESVGKDSEIKRMSNWQAGDLKLLEDGLRVRNLSASEISKVRAAVLGRSASGSSSPAAASPAIPTGEFVDPEAASAAIAALEVAPVGGDFSDFTGDDSPAAAVPEVIRDVRTGLVSPLPKVSPPSLSDLPTIFIVDPRDCGGEKFNTKACADHHIAIGKQNEPGLKAVNDIVIRLEAFVRNRKTVLKEREKLYKNGGFLSRKDKSPEAEEWRADMERWEAELKAIEKVLPDVKRRQSDIRDQVENGPAAAEGIRFYLVSNASTIEEAEKMKEEWEAEDVAKAKEEEEADRLAEVERLEKEVLDKDRRAQIEKFALAGLSDSDIVRSINDLLTPEEKKLAEELRSGVREEEKRVRDREFNQLLGLQADPSAFVEFEPLTDKEKAQLDALVEQKKKAAAQVEEEKNQGKVTCSEVGRCLSGSCSQIAPTGYLRTEPPQNVTTACAAGFSCCRVNTSFDIDNASRYDQKPRPWGGDLFPDERLKKLIGNKVPARVDMSQYTFIEKQADGNSIVQSKSDNRYYKISPDGAMLGQVDYDPNRFSMEPSTVIAEPGSSGVSDAEMEAYKERVREIAKHLPQPAQTSEDACKTPEEPADGGSAFNKGFFTGCIAALESDIAKNEMARAPSMEYQKTLYDKVANLTDDAKKLKAQASEDDTLAQKNNLERALKAIQKQKEELNKLGGLLEQKIDSFGDIRGQQKQRLVSVREQYDNWRVQNAGTVAEREEIEEEIAEEKKERELAADRKALIIGTVRIEAIDPATPANSKEPLGIRDWKDWSSLGNQQYLNTILDSNLTPDEKRLVTNTWKALYEHEATRIRAALTKRRKKRLERLKQLVDQGATKEQVVERFKQEFEKTFVGLDDWENLSPATQKQFPKELVFGTKEVVASWGLEGGFGTEQVYLVELTPEEDTLLAGLIVKREAKAKEKAEDVAKIGAQDCGPDGKPELGRCFESACTAVLPPKYLKPIADSKKACEILGKKENASYQCCGVNTSFDVTVAEKYPSKPPGWAPDIFRDNLDELIDPDQVPETITDISEYDVVSYNPETGTQIVERGGTSYEVDADTGEVKGQVDESGRVVAAPGEAGMDPDILKKQEAFKNSVYSDLPEIEKNHEPLCPKRKDSREAFESCMETLEGDIETNKARVKDLSDSWGDLALEKGVDIGITQELEGQLAQAKEELKRLEEKKDALQDRQDLSKEDILQELEDLIVSEKERKEDLEDGKKKNLSELEASFETRISDYKALSLFTYGSLDLDPSYRKGLEEMQGSYNEEFLAMKDGFDLALELIEEEILALEKETLEEDLAASRASSYALKLSKAKEDLAAAKAKIEELNGKLKEEKEREVPIKKYREDLKKHIVEQKKAMETDTSREAQKTLEALEKSLKEKTLAYQKIQWEKERLDAARKVKIQEMEMLGDRVEMLEKASEEGMKNDPVLRANQIDNLDKAIEAQGRRIEDLKKRILDWEAQETAAREEGGLRKQIETRKAQIVELEKQQKEDQMHLSAQKILLQSEQDKPVIQIAEMGFVSKQATIDQIQFEIDTLEAYDKEANLRVAEFDKRIPEDIAKLEQYKEEFPEYLLDNVGSLAEKEEVLAKIFKDRLAEAVRQTRLEHVEDLAFSLVTKDEIETTMESYKLGVAQFLKRQGDFATIHVDVQKYIEKLLLEGDDEMIREIYVQDLFGEDQKLTAEEEQAIEERIATVKNNTQQSDITRHVLKGLRDYSCGSGGKGKCLVTKHNVDLLKKGGLPPSYSCEQYFPLNYARTIPEGEGDESCETAREWVSSGLYSVGTNGVVINTELSCCAFNPSYEKEEPKSYLVDYYPGRTLSEVIDDFRYSSWAPIYFGDRSLDELIFWKVPAELHDRSAAKSVTPSVDPVTGNTRLESSDGENTYVFELDERQSVVAQVHLDSGQKVALVKDQLLTQEEIGEFLQKKAEADVKAEEARVKEETPVDIVWEEEEDEDLCKTGVLERNKIYKKDKDGKDVLDKDGKKIPIKTVFDGPGLGCSPELTVKKVDPFISRHTNLPLLAIWWTKFFLGFAAVIAVIAIIWAGILFVTSFLNEGNNETAKKVLLWAVVGIILILGAFAIVNTFITANPI